MRDFTKQLRQFRTQTDGVWHYSPEANEFLKTIKPASDEIVVYKDLSFVLPRGLSYGFQPGCVFTTPRIALVSSSYESLRKYGVFYQQGKPAEPSIPQSRLFSFARPDDQYPVWRCLAPANSEYHQQCLIPGEERALKSWKDKVLTPKFARYCRYDVVLCDSITVLDFLGDYKRDICSL